MPKHLIFSGFTRFASIVFWLYGGRGWIRTIEAKTQQIYSLPPLATRELSHIQLELVDGFEPPTC